MSNVKKLITNLEIVFVGCVLAIFLVPIFIWEIFCWLKDMEKEPFYFDGEMH